MASNTGGSKDDKYTYDLRSMDGGPRIPDMDDLGGSEQTDLDPAPQHGTMPTAGSNNEHVRNLVGLNRMTEKALICIEIAGGQAIILYAQGMGTDVLPPVFTATRISAGIVQLTWSPYTLPPIQSAPRAWSNTPLYQAAGTWIPGNPNGIEVRTWSGVTLGDAAFTVAV